MTVDRQIKVLIRLLRFDGVRFVEWNPLAQESLSGKPLGSIQNRWRKTLDA
jgi:aryl-alcohol dehydrogenase-like predicted oxidoreductase